MSLFYKHSIVKSLLLYLIACYPIFTYVIRFDYIKYKLEPCMMEFVSCIND